MASDEQPPPGLLKQYRIYADDKAFAGSGPTLWQARLRLIFKAHTARSFSVEDEDTAMALRKVTGGTGAAIRVAESHLIPDPCPGDSLKPSEAISGRGVLILTTDNCTPGGIQRYAWTWGEAALDLGREARIASLWKQGAINGVGVSRLRAAWFALKALATALIRRPEAVVAAHLALSPVAMIIKRLLGVPYAVTLHGDDAWAEPAGLTRRAICGADLLIPVSHFTRDVVAGMFGLSRDHFYVTGSILAPKLQLTAGSVEGGTSVSSDFAATPKARETQTLLTVSRLDLNAPYKRHDLVLRSVAALAAEYPNLTYHIVGDGPYRADLEALATELGIGDRVDFLGRIPEASLAEENAAAYAFVMPSRISLEPPEGEGFGLVYLEAGIYGVPSVAANGGGSTETVLDGVTGILVEPDSLDSLVAGIRKLLDDKVLRDQLGKMAPLRAIEFSYPVFRRKCAAVLAALTEGKDPQQVEPEHNPHAIAPWIVK